MPPYDDYYECEVLARVGKKVDEFRMTAERLVLSRHTEEVKREVERLKKDDEMRKVCRQLHTLAPRQTFGIIKTMRLIYGLGLKEAKEMVEQEAPLY